MNAFSVARTVISVLFFLCYFYQIVYLFVPFLRKTPRKPSNVPCRQGSGKQPRIAVLIAARNEEAVIGQLLESVSAQTYTGEVTAFVVADNCTDRTAELSGKAGAVVYERHNEQEKGKGYALNFLLKRMAEDFGGFDAYLVLDADNLLERDYIEQMAATMDQGYEIITSYRNSKNYGDNWISAGYSLWFLRESEFLNRPRTLLGTSAAVSGTGFLFTRRILEQCGGWNFFLLTEDIQFTVHNILSGVKIGYCRDAVLYDEQPVKFSQSWRQRERWAKGFLQVFRSYGVSLVRGAVGRRSFSCFDMCMNILPAMFLSIVSILLFAVELTVRLALRAAVASLFLGALQGIVGMALFLMTLGAITTATQWNRIHAGTAQKIKAVLTFPLFMFTYIPISISVLFKRVEWKPIEHSVNLSITDMGAEKSVKGHKIVKKIAVLNK